MNTIISSTKKNRGKIFVGCLIIVIISISLFVFHKYHDEITAICLRGKKIELSDIKNRVYGDSILLQRISDSIPLKIVSFVENGYCPDCLRKYLSAAQKFVDGLHNDSIIFICILNTDSIQKYYNSVYGINPQYVHIYCEKEDITAYSYLKKINPNYRTFLLNKENEIILVGNPLISRKMLELYKTIMNNPNKLM